MAKFDVPEGLEQDSLKALEISRNTGKVRRGTNEVTKVIEREKAKIVYIANDVQPPEIVAHLPALCDEKKIPFTYVREKNDLGRASGIDVSTAAVAIVDPGKAKAEVAKVIEKVKGLRTSKAPAEGKKTEEKKAEAKKEDKPAKKEAPKKEEKKEAKKTEKPAEPAKEEKPKDEKPAEKPEKSAEKKEEKKEEKKADDKKPDTKKE